MREIDSILDAWAACDARGADAVLATVVDVEGCANRIPGARMLVTSDGQRVGSIGDRYMDSDVEEKCWRWTEAGHPVTRVYDTPSEYAPKFQYAKGITRILLERLGTNDAKSVTAFLNLCRVEGKAGVMATVISSPSPDVAPVGDRWFLQPDGTTRGNLSDMMVRDWTEAEADAVLFDERSRVLTVPHSLGNIDVFVELIAPLAPVVRPVQDLGWHATTVDSCASQIGPAARF